MNVVIPAISWNVIGPELILSLTAMVLLLIIVLAKKAAGGAIPYLGLAGVLIALLLLRQPMGTFPVRLQPHGGPG